MSRLVDMWSIEGTSTMKEPSRTCVEECQVDDEGNDGDLDAEIRAVCNSTSHLLHEKHGCQDPLLTDPAAGTVSFHCFAERLELFAKSLHGICTAAAVSAQRPKLPPNPLEEIILQRQLQTKPLEESIAENENEGDDDYQVNDEKVLQANRSTELVTEVFDPSFRFSFEVPTNLITHFPPVRLNITRLVFCRNYRPGELASCSMGDGCKFIHADVDFRVLEAHPIHVKYSWRHEGLCTYARLPAGETLHVLAPNNRPPTDEIPSERILVTKGSLRRHDHDGPLSHCAHYYFNRMCNRGERCCFIHAVHVDPTVTGDFKRAPCCKTKNDQMDPTQQQLVDGGVAMNPSLTSSSGKRKQGATRSAQHLSSSSSSVPNIFAPPFYPNMPWGGAQTAPAMPNGGGGAQYGMLVFVPCDPNSMPTPVSAAMMANGQMVPQESPPLPMLPTVQVGYHPFGGAVPNFGDFQSTSDATGASRRQRSRGGMTYSGGGAYR